VDSSPLYSYYRGTTPTSLTDHILFTQACHRHPSRAGVWDGSFFSTLSDHRPVLLALQLWILAPSLPTDRFLSRPPSQAPGLDLAHPESVTRFQKLLVESTDTAARTDPTLAGEALLRLSILSSAVTQDLVRPPSKASLSKGRTNFDGWSVVAISLKANHTARATIRGHGTYCRWTTQAHMDADIRRILHMGSPSETTI